MLILELTAAKVINVLNQLKAANKLPVKIRSDNGREFRSHNIAKWCIENNVQWEFIQRENQCRMVVKDLMEHLGMNY